MKKLLKLLPVILLTVLIAGCSDDEDDFDREYHVLFKVSCNNPQAHLKNWNGEDNPIIMGHWEEKYTTKFPSTGYTVESLDDPYANITVKLYVDGRLKLEDSDYGEIKVVYKLNEHSY